MQRSRPQFLCGSKDLIQMNDKLIYWVWLNLRLIPGDCTLSKLLQVHSDPKRIYSATREEYQAILTEKCKEIEALCDKDLTYAERVVAYCEKHEIGILCYDDNAYPQKLREIKTPPAVLYWYGTVPNFEKLPMLSVVGTRKMTDYGKEAAYRIAGDLALGGVAIVSGMALGVDSVALAAGITARMPTVAVLGSGIDVIYPHEHARLYDQIKKTGWIISEYPPGTPPEGKNFPRRNRIISALSDAVLVVEGSERSGALITAEYALEQNKPLFAVPGRVDCTNSGASLLLFHAGATAVGSATDVFHLMRVSGEKEFHFFESERVDMKKMNANLRQLGISKYRISYAELFPKRKEKRIPKLESDEPTRRVIPGYEDLVCSLPEGDFSPEDIKGIDPDRLNSGLTMLMLGNLVTPLPGGKFRRNY